MRILAFGPCGCGTAGSRLTKSTELAPRPTTSQTGGKRTGGLRSESQAKRSQTNIGAARTVAPGCVQSTRSGGRQVIAVRPDATSAASRRPTAAAASAASPPRCRGHRRRHPPKSAPTAAEAAAGRLGPASFDRGVRPPRQLGLVQLVDAPAVRRRRLGPSRRTRTRARGRWPCRASRARNPRDPSSRTSRLLELGSIPIFVWEVSNEQPTTHGPDFPGVPMKCTATPPRVFFEEALEKPRPSGPSTPLVVGRTSRSRCVLHRRAPIQHRQHKRGPGYGAADGLMPPAGFARALPARH